MMLDYTYSAFRVILSDIKRIAFWTTVFVQLMMIGFPVYSIFASGGNIYLNIPLAAVSAVFLVFYIIQALDENASRAPARITKRVRKALKYINKIYNVVIAVYGIYVASEHTTLVSLIYAGVMVIALILGFLLDILLSYCTARIVLVRTAMETDLSVITRPLGKVQGAIDWVRGVEHEEEAPPTAAQLRAKSYLDEQVAELRVEKGRKKAEARATMADAWRGRIKGIFKRGKKKEDAPNQAETSESVKK